MSRVGRWLVAAGVAIPMFGGMLDAGTEVRSPQTETKKVREGEYASPMVLETPFTAAQPEHLGQWVTVDDMAKFVCDAVSVNELRIRATLDGAVMRIHLVAQTYTAPGHDKAAEITYELMSGDDVLGTATSGKIDAEEKKKAHGSTVLLVAAAKMPKDAVPVLRLTVSVRDN